MSIIFGFIAKILSIILTKSNPRLFLNFWTKLNKKILIFLARRPRFLVWSCQEIQEFSWVSIDDPEKFSWLAKNQLQDLGNKSENCKKFLGIKLISPLISPIKLNFRSICVCCENSYTDLPPRYFQSMQFLPSIENSTVYLF